MIAVDLSKQQALNADPEAIQQIDFRTKVDRAENTRIYHSWRSKRNYLRRFTKNRKNFVNAIPFNAIPFNAIPLNVISLNAISLNTIPLNNLIFINIK